MPSPLWIIPATTFSLGIWQINRLFWKLDLIEQASTRQSLAPIPLQDLLESSSSNRIPERDKIQKTNTLPNLDEFTRVSLKGLFAHDQEMLVGPRPIHDGQEASSRAAGFRNSGYLVITPFYLSDYRKDGVVRKVLINRGWLPTFLKEDTRRKEMNEKVENSSEIEIEGFVRSAEPGSMLMSSSIPSLNKWYSVDVEKMAQWTNSLPILIEMTRDGHPNQSLIEKEGEKGGYPILRVPTATFRNQHLEYALTWFGLSLCSAYLCLRGRNQTSRGMFSFKRKI